MTCPLDFTPPPRDPGKPQEGFWRVPEIVGPYLATLHCPSFALREEGDLQNPRQLGQSLFCRDSWSLPKGLKMQAVNAHRMDPPHLAEFPSMY